MKKYIKISVFLFLLLTQKHLMSQVPNECGEETGFSWIKTAGGISNDEINDITTDAEGNIYITGAFSDDFSFQSTTTTSKGRKDFFVAKLNIDGNLIWLKTGGGVENDFGTGVTVDDFGNIFVVGTYNGNVSFDEHTLNSSGNDDIFFIKYSPYGDIIWIKKFGGPQKETSGGICVDNQNNIIFTGSYQIYINFDGRVIFSNGGMDMFVVKFDNNGSIIWVGEHGSPSNDVGIDVATDNNQNIFVIGEFYQTISFDSHSTTSNGGKDVFLAKLNSAGDAQWVKKAGTSNDDAAGSVAIDPSGNSYICCKKNQTLNQGCIQKYNSEGTLVLDVEFGESGNVFPKAIATDNNNNIVVTGKYQNNTDFGDGIEVSNGTDDYFLVRYLNDGNFNYKHFGGSPSSDCGNSLCINNNGNIIVGGVYQNNFNIQQTNHEAIGDNDIMIVKYDKYFLFGDVTVSSIQCNPNNMCIDTEIIGGTAPFTHSWSNGLSNPDICGLTAGIYTLTVTDNTGCAITKTITVEALSLPIINIPIIPQICPFDSVTLDIGDEFVNYLWSTGETTHSIRVLHEGSYFVTVTDDNSCSSTAQIDVTKLPNVPLFSEDVYYYCPQTQSNILIEGYERYLWSNGSPYPYLQTNRDGEYWLRVFDGECYYYDTLQLERYALTNINLSSDRTTICEGDSILLTTATNFISYLWPDNSTSNTYWASETGQIYVTVIDANNCRDSASINISHVPRPIVNLGNDTTICSDIGHILSPNNPHTNTSYLWSNNTTDTTFLASQTGRYWVRATSNLGACHEYDTINVVIHPLPTLNLGDDIVFCENDSVKLEITTNYPDILWSTGNTTNTIYVSETANIFVQVTDNNQCSKTDTISLFQSIVPYPFLGNDTTLCTNANLLLSPQEEYYQYTWSTGSSTSYIEITTPGTYQVTVSDEHNCTKSDAINISFQVHPEILEIESVPGAIFIHGTGGTPPYQYSLDNINWQEQNEFNNYPSADYTAVISDANHCKSTKDFFLDPLYRIPSFFTPNGDGYNDTWKIEGLYHSPNATVKIFDRYGKEIFEFKSPNDEWDGTYLGHPVHNDTYWYIIDLKRNNRTVKGHVTIKR
ncbi:T9SS type B sorting domain-containing protein [Bacteroidales bacterium OttesenSCG-928-I21]|nr:T9SS type B sorting domain-containing protein [Bacteroidales bacterium OttesenSCG-928-I21]